MAIFVSNPTSAAVPTLSSDALEPLAVAPEEGFTEELAAAMQPSAVTTEASETTPLDKLDEAGKKAADLQILPAEVLMNAVEMQILPWQVRLVRLNLQLKIRCLALYGLRPLMHLRHL
jgi:hypothetical protein